SRSFISETSLPFSQYSPSSGESRQPIRFISVDLPDPDGPMIATYSPFSIDRSMPRSAWISSPPIRHLRFRLCVWISALTLRGLAMTTALRGSSRGGRARIISAETAGAHRIRHVTCCRSRILKSGGSRARRRSSEMLAKETHRPLERELGVRGAIRGAVAAIEAVIRVGVDVEHAVRNRL